MSFTCGRLIERWQEGVDVKVDPVGFVVGRPGLAEEESGSAAVTSVGAGAGFDEFGEYVGW
ncbi:hypothetical protein GCM10010411_72130 [Actinomadura fulvescens]|uniref:Uncharacterized protein n=1 Tax=Actinomadura fulvescens TaxID=46160 RepID=A0ABN3QFF1_9ACTN